MASTYSTNLAIELIGTGEQSGTWGTTTNTNLGTLIEQSISGYVTQAITDGSGANTTITIPNGATGVARNMFIEMTGALTFSTTSLIVPANKKMYFIFNNTTGGFAVTVKVSGQTGILVPNGKKVVLTSNGTDIVEAHTAIVGNATMGGTLGITGTTTAAAINASGLVAMAGAATVGTTLAVSGTATMAAINASGLVAMAGAATVGTTLGVTGTSTMAAINASGTVAMAGAATVGTTLAVTGTSTMAAINYSGRLTQALSPVAAEYALKSSGQTTGWIAVQVDNTGGSYIFAGENSAGNNLITGDSAYDLVIRAPSGISFSANAGATQQMRIASTGAVTIPGTLGVSTGAAVGGATPGAGGVAFPATAVSVADANTLDDYEEGTWTPSITSGSGTLVSVGTQTGRYTKIGRLVTIECQSGITLNGTGASYILISGLPFQSNVVTPSSGSGREVGITDKEVSVVIGLNSTQATLRFYDGTYPGSSGAIFQFSITYSV